MPRDEENAKRIPASNLENTLENLLPVPSSSEATRSRVDGPIDVLLPTPEDAEPVGDDASTREELEVDTSADNIDDIIPLCRPE